MWRCWGAGWKRKMSRKIMCKGKMSRKIMCKGKMSKGKNCRKKRSIRIIRREKK